MKIAVVFCIYSILTGCVDFNKSTQNEKFEKVNKTADSSKAVIVDTSILDIRIKIYYNWQDEALYTNINDDIYDTSYYFVNEGWDLYKPIFKFQDSSFSNIYYKSNTICYALPYNHVNTFTVFVYKINNLLKKIEICKDIKCSSEVYIKENEGLLSTFYNKDPINGIYKIDKLEYKIGKCP